MGDEAVDFPFHTARIIAAVEFVQDDPAVRIRNHLRDQILQMPQKIIHILSSVKLSNLFKPLRMREMHQSDTDADFLFLQEFQNLKIPFHLRFIVNARSRFDPGPFERKTEGLMPQLRQQINILTVEFPEVAGFA